MGTNINFSKKLGKIYGTSINLQIATCTDPDSTAFLLATGITDPVISAAICNLVVGLKADGLWSKMKAIYPFVGGTATTHKFNLKNPLDTNAAFRLVFSGGWIHSSTGAKPNGVNAFANTFLIPTVDLNYGSLGYYSRTSTPELTSTDSNGIAIGVRSDNNSTVNNTFNLRIKSNPSNNNDFFYSRTGSTINTSSRSVNASGLGFFVGTLDASTTSLYRNGLSMSPTYLSLSRSTPNLPVYIGSLNNKGVAAEFTLKESAFAHIGTELTNTDVVNLNIRVQAFEVALSRNV
jgi:hypothetical protein